MPRPNDKTKTASSYETESEQDTSDDHFSDASEGEPEGPDNVPATRVVKIDETPSHGEVPGTEAFDKRRQDATPDEVVVQPEDGLSTLHEDSEPSAVKPNTIVEEVAPGQLSHGHVPGTEAYEIRKADAEPDAIIKAPEVAGQSLEDIAPDIKQESESFDNGDDFDDFEEGEEGDTFGAFDDGSSGFNQPQEAVLHPAIPQSSLPVLDFEGLDTRSKVLDACTPYLKNLLPLNDAVSTPQSSFPEVNASLLNERSQSLWNQLVAPPPLQPPNWIRSRIRRLFLVSLGVPVDLDEILPASKQKKLILPSVDIGGSRSRQGSSAPRPQNGDITRLKNDNGSSSSVNTQGSKGERKKKKGAAAPPSLDLNEARLMCTTTDTALHNLTDSEIRAHITRLDHLKGMASELLQYWLVQKDSATGDKEAFEEVIENLVKHAKKIRK